MEEEEKEKVGEATLSHQRQGGDDSGDGLYSSDPGPWGKWDRRRVKVKALISK